MPNSPARTPSFYVLKLFTNVQESITRPRVRPALLTLLAGALLFSGCNAVNGGLSSNLPPAGGGGVLTFESVAMPDGIAGRTYSKVAVTSVLAETTTKYPVSPTIVSGTAPLASCSITSGSLPPGMNAALTIDGTGAGCVISGTPLAADAGNSYQFTVQALDSNSPPRAATQTFTMKVRPEFTVSAPSAIVANTLPAGVQGRSYGQIAGNLAQMTMTTTLSATVGNGLVAANKNYCVVTASGVALALNLAASGTNNNCILQNSAALTAGSYKVTLAVTDSPITDPETNLQAVPANTIAAATNATLNVGVPLHLAAQADAVSATPPNAVQGRAYGTGSGCAPTSACAPLTYLSTGGLPSVESADSYLFTSSAALTSAGITCAGTASSAVAKTTCSGTGAAIGTANFSVTVDDPGNLATPSGSASGTTGSVAGLSLTVDPTLSLAVSPDPATNSAVQNRAYGTGTGCTGAGGNCLPPTYTPSGGLGGYSFTITGSAPTGIACAANGGDTAVVCSGTASSTAATSTFAVSATDTANASTPSGSTAPVSKTLTVDGTLTLTAPASLPTAVNLRAFGTGAGCTGGACAPAAFAVAGGLGTYSANATIVSAPGAWTCPLAGTNYNCASTSVVSGTPNLSITAADAGNAATPSQTTSAASVAITVNPQLALTPPASVPDAVTGRAFGSGSGCSGGACAAIKYVISGGLGNYLAGTLAVGNGSSDTLACSVAALTYSCTTATINGGAVSNALLTMTAPETGNVSTPSASVVDTSRTLNIDSKIVLTPSLGTTWPAAVQGRAYAGAGFSADQFTAANGIPPYVFPATTPATFPSGFSCPAVLGATYTCSATSVTAASAVFHPQVTVQDTGNASTPASTVATDPASQVTASLTLNAPLTLTPPASLPTAVNLRAYGAGSGCTGGGGACVPAQFTIAGGLGSYSAANIIAAPGTWTCPLTPTGPLAGTYNCSSASVGNGSSLSLTASDTADSTTPNATTSTATASIAVNPALALTPPGTVNDAVTGRPYGLGICTGPTACTAIIYSVSGGLGNYATGTLTAGTDTFSCSAAPNYSCTKAAIATTAGSQTLTMSASETGNASAPSATVTDTSRSINIDAPVTLAATIASPWPPAVQGRTYAEGATQNQFNATGGIGPYVSFTPSNFPTGFMCTAIGSSATCSSGDVLGAVSSYSPAVTVVDTGDGSTPPATTTTDPLSVVTSSLTVDAPLAINAIALPNGLLNYPYPTVSTEATLSSTGGLGGDTWIGPTGTAGACPSLTGSFPTGTFVVNSTSTTATITGTPTAASTSPGQFAFQVCVTDTGNSMTPPGFAVPNTTGNTLSIDVLNPYAYIAEPSVNELDIVNTSTDVDSLISLSGTAPYGVAFSPSGRYAYVTLSATNQLAVFDTITNTQITGSPISLTGCTTPHGVAATSAFIFVACNGSGNIVYLDTAAFGVNTIATDSGTSAPEGIAIRPDGLRVYATLSAENELFIIDNSGATPVAFSTPTYTLLTTDGTAPLGIAIAPTTTGTLAYIAKDGASSTVPDGVEVVILTNDSFSSTGLPTSADSSAVPNSVAVTPDGLRVYVTLTGADEFAVFDTSPAAISGSPFTLATAAAAPQGVTIPPLLPVPTATNFLVYIAQNAANNLAVIDNLTPPSTDTTTPTITLSGTAPAAMASTPAPQ
jgi:sugar lactone lactonase YvrE